MGVDSEATLKRFFEVHGNITKVRAMGNTEFLQGISRIAESVDAFHDRFRISKIDTDDTEVTLELLRQRLALLAEETGEHARALNRADIADATKEAVDILYIAVGTIHRLGTSGVKACHEVATKNDSKVPSSHSAHSVTGKVLAD